MTVGELIRELEACDQNKVVKVSVAYRGKNGEMEYGKGTPEVEEYEEYVFLPGFP
jgi:hypothetical protein